MADAFITRHGGGGAAAIKNSVPEVVIPIENIERDMFIEAQNTATISVNGFNNYGFATFDGINYIAFSNYDIRFLRLDESTGQLVYRGKQINLVNGEIYGNTIVGVYFLSENFAVFASVYKDGMNGDAGISIIHIDWDVMTIVSTSKSKSFGGGNHSFDYITPGIDCIGVEILSSTRFIFAVCLSDVDRGKDTAFGVYEASINSVGVMSITKTYADVILGESKPGVCLSFAFGLIDEDDTYKYLLIQSVYGNGMTKATSTSFLNFRKVLKINKLDGIYTEEFSQVNLSASTSSLNAITNTNESGKMYRLICMRRMTVSLDKYSTTRYQPINSNNFNPSSSPVTISYASSAKVEGGYGNKIPILAMQNPADIDILPFVISGTATNEQDGIGKYIINNKVLEHVIVFRYTASGNGLFINITSSRVFCKFRGMKDIILVGKNILSVTKKLAYKAKNSIRGVSDLESLTNLVEGKVSLLSKE